MLRPQVNLRGRNLYWPLPVPRLSERSAAVTFEWFLRSDPDFAKWNTGRDMSYNTSVSLPPRLHEQALLATLHLVDEMQSIRPSIADVAARLDVPQASLRSLFTDDRALLIAAGEQALVILIDDCTRAMAKVDPEDPVAQFTALGEIYLEWAGRHQAAFRLLSDSRLLDSLHIPSLRRYVDSLADLMQRMLSRARDQGRIHPQEDIDLIALSARSFAFGVASMIVDGRMEAWAPGRDPVEAGKHLTRDFVRRMACSGMPPPVKPAEGAQRGATD